MILNFLKSGYQKISSALAKTRSLLGDKLKALFQHKIDEEILEKLEQLLYEADLGVHISHQLTEKIRILHQKNPSISPETLLDAIRKEIATMIKPSDSAIHLPKNQEPLVILIVGVNGNGKTTSIAKLANRFVKEGYSPLLAAADTFRAAAIEQLEIWAERLKVDIVKGSSKSDPAAVVFDALNAAKARNKNIVLIDTAGRLHTKTHLMQELEKIKRSCKKIYPTSPHETWLVLDATTGQNAIDQAKIFHQFTPITGLVLTKLDGTAKGGIVISIQQQLNIPVKFIGIGEGLDDLEPFNAESFIQALFEG